MELIVKLYNDKPSRLGVRYIYEYLAIREYEELIRKFGPDTVSIQFELLKSSLNLTLRSDGTGAKFIYKELEFKMEHLKKLQHFITTGSLIEFVHIFPKNNTLLIAKPFRGAQFLKVSTIDFISAGAVNLS